MYKQSPSRTQRSKGFKVKHALQICLLVAVCFWLIYQVKHYHDKKRDFDEHDVKISLDSARKDNVVKLGRKDLHPLKERTVVESDKHEEEEVEEDDVEEETTVEQKENTHEEEMKEKDENGDGRGGGEEEVDEEVEEEITVEEEENKHEEEGKDENGELRRGREEEVDDHDQEKHDNLGGTTNRHEAREENYNADDASSAVTLDTQLTSNGNHTGILGKLNEQATVNNVESRDIDEGDAGQNASVNVTSNESHIGATTNEQSQTTISNSTQVRGGVLDVSLLDQNEDQRVTQGVTNSSNFEMKYDLTSKAEGNSTMMEDSSISENIQDDEEGQINKSLSENSYDMKLDMEDSSDSKLSLEEKDVRTDLETLPDIKTEGGNSEDE